MARYAVHLSAMQCSSWACSLLFPDQVSLDRFHDLREKNPSRLMWPLAFTNQAFD